MVDLVAYCIGRIAPSFVVASHLFSVLADRWASSCLRLDPLPSGEHRLASEFGSAELFAVWNFVLLFSFPATEWFDNRIKWAIGWNWEFLPF